MKKIAFLLLIVASLPAFAGTGAIRRAQRPIPNEYIVVLKTTDANVVDLIASDLAARHTGRVIVTLKNGFKGFGITLPEAKARALSLDPRVEFVEENGLADIAQGSYTLHTFTDDTYWGLDRIDQRRTVDGRKSYAFTYTGLNVNAYVVDTGIQAHHTEFDLDQNPNTVGSRVLPGVNFNGQAFPANNPCGGYVDNYGGGHGTAVASLIGGRTMGVAKDVTLIPVSVGSCEPITPTFPNGRSTISNLGICYGLDWIIGDAASPDNRDPITSLQRRAVVNMSVFILGGSQSECDGQLCVPAVENNVGRVINANIPVVTSANNQGNDLCNTTPARMGNPAYGTENNVHPITVGATNIADGRWVCQGAECTPQTVGSNFGPCVNIYAPGANLHVAHINSFTGFRTQLFSGTSFSAPIVTGVVARLLQQHSTWTPAQIWSHLAANATHLPNDLDPSGTFNDSLIYISEFE